MIAYLARRGKRRCYVVARTREKAFALAEKVLGTSEYAKPSLTAIDDEVFVDTTEPTP